MKHTEVHSHATPIESSRSMRVARRVGGGLVRIVAAATVFNAAFAYKEIGVMLRQPTADEAFIADKLQKSVLNERGWVHCTDNVPQGDVGAVRSVFGVWAIPVMNIDSGMCKYIVDYAHLKNKNKMTQNHMEALDTAVHESQHVELDSGDEQRIACIALQRVGEFAVALGASPEEASRAQKIDVTVYHKTLPSNYKSEQCRDGGQFDLAPTTVGIFPYDGWQIHTPTPSAGHNVTG